MSYKEKFEESQHKAHYTNIATKILRDMTTLRSNVENSPNTARRWIWELIQNAKDVQRGNGINIQISRISRSGKEYLVFRHDGLPFSADNIRFLIEQISSKDRKKDDQGRNKQTGKFGTGFLTTHMLAEKVQVRGILKEDDLGYKQFKLNLDRSGNEIDEIIASVEASMDSITNIDSIPVYDLYNENHLNTSFIYSLQDSLSIEVAAKGLEDMNHNLPFSLCFIDSIKNVSVEPSEVKYYTLNKENYNDIPGLHIYSIGIESPGKIIEEVQLMVLLKGFTSIAVPVKLNDNTIEILVVGNGVPKIYCDFPLIGTENFPFPVVINNPNFNPTDERDGIYLTDTRRENLKIDFNKKIVKRAVELYLDLLDIASENGWINIHLLAKLGTLKEPYLTNTSSSWFETEVQEPIRIKLEKTSIVLNAKNILSPILNKDDSYYTWFPSGSSKNLRKRIHEISSFWFPHVLPHMDHIEFWNSNIWEKCGKLTLLQLGTFIESKETLKSLQSCLTGIDVIDWLNEYYELLKIYEKDGATIFEKKSIVPNQNGSLLRKNQLFYQSEDIEEEFKDILKQFGKDVRETLCNQNLKLVFEQHDNYNQSDILKEIISETIDKTNDREVANTYRPAFDLILKYFALNEDKSKKWLNSIYSRKHLLYDDAQILDNINKADELNELLVTFKVSSTEELRSKFEQFSEAKTSLLPITEDILASMGITSLEEWEIAMRDTDLKALFEHKSVPSIEMFVFAQGHIKRAKERVINYLSNLDEYDLSQMDDTTAPTILADVFKHERPIRIVFRPAYNQEVILYYGAERDTLDFADSELWVDTGAEIKSVSLGHIIKTNDIKKFPI